MRLVLAGQAQYDDTRSNKMKANRKIVTEQFSINRLASKIVIQPSDSDTDTQLTRGACDFQ